MPSKLLCSDIISTVKEETKNTPTIGYPRSSSSACIDQSSWINFLSSAIGFGKQRKHGEKGCQNCDMVASYYLQLLEESQRHEMNALVVELVWQMTKLLLEHMETRLYHQLEFFDVMARELYQYCKRLKEDQAEGELENAIRITIYHCRATIYQHDGGMDDLIRARLYFQKCLRLPTKFEAQKSLQKTACTFISQHPLVLYTPSSINTNNDSSYFSLPPPLQSPSSIISTPSSSSLSSTSSTPLITPCGHCGLQKKAMPVCAKCKSQRYCTIKCLKEHQSSHMLICRK
ncbi:unnamed protein product [Absidia cylindrospora]